MKDRTDLQAMAGLLMLVNSGERHHAGPCGGGNAALERVQGLLASSSPSQLRLAATVEKVFALTGKFRSECAALSNCGERVGLNYLWVKAGSRRLGHAHAARGACQIVPQLLPTLCTSRRRYRRLAERL